MLEDRAILRLKLEDRAILRLKLEDRAVLLTFFVYYLIQGAHCDRFFVTLAFVDSRRSKLKSRSTFYNGKKYF